MPPVSTSPSLTRILFPNRTCVACCRISATSESAWFRLVGATQSLLLLLTRLQAVYLDAHFIIEHLARNRSGCFFNFNGTGGVWRKRCLLDAGNWQQDTLTEDLDISYRAQLQGWRFVFAADTVVPSELPVEVTGFKTQQFRWAKGSIQTALKLLGPVLRSSHPRKVKLEAFFHLRTMFIY
jgi:cellulose synthase/poly-beta-1,6-N-acetylglucosamine synthase-like glycosyltransferase